MEEAAVAVRYFLIAAGFFVVGRGWATQDSWASFMSAWDSFVGGAVALFPIVWGFYVNWKTKRVPAVEAEAKRLRTVSPITGQVRKP